MRRMEAPVLTSAVGGLLLACDCLAAGGHHAIEDAAILEPGQCHVETWVERADAARRRLLHVGPACRLGFAEVALNLDRNLDADGSSTATAYGPQIKWAGAWGEHTSVGALWSATWLNRSPRLLGQTLVLALSWKASDSLAVHLNAGRDVLAGAPDLTRAGAALEWTPL